jgi:hypothetical protein
MNTTTLTQEEIALDLGHCLDPLSPLWESGIQPDRGIAARLFAIAQEVDEVGQEFDWMDDLPQHTEDIQNGLFAWYAVAIKSWKIKLFKAYKGTFKSFQQFCEVALGCSSAAINTKIRAARVLSQLISLGFERLPQSPSVCIELVKLGWESLADTWRDILMKFSDHEITAEKVRNMIEDPLEKRPQTKTVRIPIKEWHLIEEQAAIAGMKPNHFLYSLLENSLGGQSDDGIRVIEQLENPSKEEWLDIEPEEGIDLPSSDLPEQGDWPIQCDHPDEPIETNGKGDLSPYPKGFGNQEPIAPKAKVKSADYELFRVTYNENRPQAWAEWYTVNEVQKKKILQSIKECGNQENALIAVSNALKYCASDDWWSTKRLGFMAIVRDGRLTEFHEKFVAQETQPSPDEIETQRLIDILRRNFPDAPCY